MVRILGSTSNFGVSGIAEYKSGAAVPLVTSISLPDGTQYIFAYETTPGTCTPYAGTTCTTSRLVSVTLPTAGQITYSYTGGNNGILPDGSAATLTRTTPDGAWKFAQVKNSGAASTTTMTDPQGNVSTIQFQGIYETSRVVNSGSSTILQTTNTCYNAAASPCTGTAITLPITQRDVSNQLAGSKNLTDLHVQKYDDYGNVIEQDDYDYGSGAYGSLLDKTVVSYASLGNIKAFQQTVTTTNGSGATVSQTNYNYDQTAVVTTSGTPQHNSITGSRGNLTSTNQYSSSSAYLTKTMTYFDTGNIDVTTDVNGAQTTYTYGNCGNSFPTVIAEPLGLSRSMTWNCTGGVQLTSADENSQTTTTTYNDPDFWRPYSITDPLMNQTVMGYIASGGREWGTTADLEFNSNSSMANIGIGNDGLGRVINVSHIQGPGASLYDQVIISYDTNGRQYTTSVPCTASSWTCPVNATTTTYDALNRVASITDGGGRQISYTYSNNDVLVTSSPAPTGENTKKRQLEYNSIGQLTSVCEVTAGTSPWPGGSCAQSTSQIGYLTKYTFNALGQITNVVQNAQSSSSQTRSYAYDFLGRLTSETNPESGTKTYVYDSTSNLCGNGPGTSNGDLMTTTDATGTCVARYYDLLHRLTDVGNNDQAANGCLRFRYDNSAGYGGTKPSGLANTLGRMVEAATDACSTTDPILTNEWFSYTPRGEVSDAYESTPNSGSGYYHTSATYWANGALNTLNGYSSSGSSIYSASWGVDGEGRPYSYPGVLTSTMYNAASQPTSLQFSSGDSDSYTYDPNTDRMTQYQSTVNGQSLAGNLTWNAISTLKTLAITDPFNSANAQTCNYTHDDLIRLATANCGSAWSQTFAYDAFGNLTQSGSLNFQPGYSNTTNHMTSIGSNTPTYDGDGNVTNDFLNTYTWNDAYGKPLTVNGVGITYDALGRMVEQNRSGAYTQFLYSPTGFEMEIMNGQSYQESFVPLPGGAEVVYRPSTTYIRHADWLGSSRFASTTSRTVYYDGAYAPFGSPYAQSGTTDVSFTGMNQDTAANVYDFPAREYGTQGRWPSPDPAGMAAVDPTNPQSWNRYAYVLNNPMAYIDPLGLHHCAPNQNGPAQNNGPCAGGISSSPMSGDYPVESYSYVGGPMTTYSSDSVVGDTTSYGLQFVGIGPPELYGVFAHVYSNQSTPIDSAILGGGASSLSSFGIGGGSSGGGGGSTVRATPTLKFKPPSWQNFTHKFLPCYGAQLVDNLVGDDDKALVTFGTVALTVAKPLLGGSLLVVWTGIAAFSAGSKCAVASRGYYQ